MIDTIVLLHGFTGSPASFEPVVDGVGAALRLVTPALAGHGAEPALPRGWTDELDRLIALLDREPLGRTHLLGYSLGGRLAWGLLAHAPERFESATIVGGHPGLRTRAERRARIAADRRWVELLEHDGIEAFLTAWEALPIFATQTPDQVAAQRPIRRSHQAGGLAHALRVVGLGAMPAVDPARIAIPVEVLVGELDRSSAAAALPHASRVVGAGHNVLVERPEAVRAILSELSRRVA